MRLKKGKFIVLEGCDGSGKTSNIPVVVSMLQEAGYDVVRTREPGGTDIAEKIRNVLLDINPEKEGVIPLTELLLFAAARVQHIHYVIAPAIAAGKIVVCDRYVDTTFAYQGIGRMLLGELKILNDHMVKPPKQDYTLFYDITEAESLKRLQARSLEINRLDVETTEFKRRLYNGYQLALQNPNRSDVFRIDAMRDLDAVKKSTASWVKEVFIRNNPLE